MAKQNRFKLQRIDTVLMKPGDVVMAEVARMRNVVMITRSFRKRVHLVQVQ